MTSKFETIEGRKFLPGVFADHHAAYADPEAEYYYDHNIHMIRFLDGTPDIRSWRCDVDPARYTYRNEYTGAQS